MQVYKSFYQIGIFDPSEYESWPWHFHYENGRYLSSKHRECGANLAAEFDSQEKARAFFGEWIHKERYKFELIEVKKWIEQPDPIYPDEHPNSILKEIESNERNTYARTARLWWSGQDLINLYTKATLKTHRKVLLKYKIDIFDKPVNQLEKEVLIDNTWHLSKPDLKSIK